MTPLQKRALKFMRSFKREHDRIPSTRELQREFGYKSQNSAQSLYNYLERAGELQRFEGRLRFPR